MPRVTQKGQITIPISVRKQLNIKQGDELIFEIQDDRAVLQKKEQKTSGIYKYVGYLSHLQGKKVDDIINDMRGIADDISN